MITDSPPLLATARARFRAQLTTFAEEHPELGAGEAAAQFGRTLPERDRELADAFLASEAHTILAWEMRASFVRNRQTIYASLGLPGPSARVDKNPDRPTADASARDQLTPANAAENKRESLYERISQWREYSPSLNRTVLLGEMNRPMLFESAAVDTNRVTLFSWKARLKIALANRLPDDTALVNSFFTPEEIATLGEQVKLEASHGNLRIAITPVRPLSGSARIQGQAAGRSAEGAEDDRGMVTLEGGGH